MGPLLNIRALISFSMIKILSLAISLILWSAVSFSQISKASLQASGLTCALCAKSIYTNLSSLNFIDSVDTDLETSTFLIVFKPAAKIDIDAIRKKVEDAGFSVSKLLLRIDQGGLTIGHDKKIKIGDNVFHFIDVKTQSAASSFEIRVIDQKFVSAKEFKKLTAGSKISCYQFTKSLACSLPQGNSGAIGIFHVTL
jgi:copper chaperone CopZ